MLVGDIEHLGDALVKNELPGTVTTAREIVPWCEMIVAGVSCTSKSRLNVNSGKEANSRCVELNTSSATNVTLRGLMEYIRRAKPTVVIVENVIELAQESAVVEAMFKDLDYEDTTLRLQAARYGSIAKRERLHIVAVVKSLGLKASWKKELGAALEKMEFQGSFTIDDFLEGDDNDSSDDDGDVAAASQPLKKMKTSGGLGGGGGGSGEAKYKDEHMATFLSYGLTWPPAWNTVGDSLKSASRRLTPRQAELVFFCDAIWPQKMGASDTNTNNSGSTNSTNSGLAEFIDVNFSMQFLVKKLSSEEDSASPWQTTLGCITGNSKLVMRRAGHFTVLSGATLMSIAGWPGLAYDYPHEMDAHTYDGLLGNMAGNAFSGFSMSALILAVMAIVLDPDSKSPTSDPSDVNKLKHAGEGEHDDDSASD